jgi:hypothetical protein
MKIKVIQSFSALVLWLGSVYAQSAVTSDIEAPQKRAVSVDLAERMLKTPSADDIQVPDGLVNPFDPTAITRIEIKSGRPGSDKELLEALADLLRPTGVMGRDEAMVLLLKGQKGVKLNDKLTLSFDGTAYDVEVIAIDHYNFSLRYNQAEVTRPIKTGKNP